MPSTTLRLSPSYRVTSVTDAPAGLLPSLANVSAEGCVVLLPTEPGRTARLVSPGLVALLTGEASCETVPFDSLIFDGIVEVWREGSWVSGPECLSAPAVVVNEADPSWTAILEARSRADLPPAALSRFLYEFGRRPFSRRWIKEIGGETAEALGMWLGLTSDPHLRRMSASWSARTDASWWYWQAPTGWERGDGVKWKLYVNVEPAQLPRALARVAEVLDTAQAAAFKVAGTVRGVLRPDKLVVYFRRREHLESAGLALAAALGRATPHFLAFTGSFKGTECVTWGVDPPSADWLDTGSWRYWLCQRMAGWLWTLREQRDEATFVRLFCARARLEGVDLPGWTPDVGLIDCWRADRGGAE